MVTQRSRWDDTGTTIPAGEAKYAVNGQPIAEYDNKHNSDVALDITDTIDELENTTTGHDHDGANSKTVDASDVVNTPSGDITSTDVQGAIDELGSITGSGSYSGDSTTNRAIPHGLGRVPKYVSIVDSVSTGYIYSIIELGAITGVSSSASARQTVTQMDATNFYVGNGTDYTRSANTALTYTWVAIG